jgi:hypothetical protein
MTKGCDQDPPCDSENIRRGCPKTLNVKPQPQNLGAIFGRRLDRLSTTQYESTVALLARDRKIRSHRTEDYV